jgi:hypothetical protein
MNPVAAMNADAAQTEPGLGDDRPDPHPPRPETPPKMPPDVWPPEKQPPPRPPDVLEPNPDQVPPQRRRLLPPRSNAASDRPRRGHARQ